MKNYVVSCIEGYVEVRKKFEEEGGTITEGLISFVLNNPNLMVTTSFGEKKAMKMTDVYAAFSKENFPGMKEHWYRVREMMGDKCRKTTSDAGCLKIGNDAFSFDIVNGYGDGFTRYAVLEKSEFNSSMMNYFSSCEGEFNIYKYDCDVNVGVSDTIKGRYGIYVFEGLIVFEKWN